MNSQKMAPWFAWERGEYGSADIRHEEYAETVPGTTHWLFNILSFTILVAYKDVRWCPR